MTRAEPWWLLVVLLLSGTAHYLFRLEVAAFADDYECARIDGSCRHLSPPFPLFGASASLSRNILLSSDAGAILAAVVLPTLSDRFGCGRVLLLNLIAAAAQTCMWLAVTVSHRHGPRSEPRPGSEQPRRPRVGDAEAAPGPARRHLAPALERGEERAGERHELPLPRLLLLLPPVLLLGVLAAAAAAAVAAVVVVVA